MVSTARLLASSLRGDKLMLCAGCVLITFKSRLSIPPYRIENKTADVMIYFAQSSVAGSREKWNWLSPCSSGSSMAYAWDEPCQTHKLQVQVGLTPSQCMVYV